MSNIAVVNIARILDESKKGKVLAATLKTAAEKWQKELADLEKQYKETQAKIEATPATATDVRFRLEKEVRMLEMDVRHLQSKAQLDVEARREQARTKVLQEVDPIMQAVAKELAIDLILSVPAKEVAYASAAIDITDKILAKFDNA